MKTSVEISGYTISIEESEGIISVNAVKEDEVVEEFTIQIEEGEEGEGFESEEGEGVKPFGEFGEEEDFEGEESQDEEDEDENDDEEDEFESQDEEDKVPEGALESFQAFINKKK